MCVVFIANANIESNVDDGHFAKFLQLPKTFQVLQYNTCIRNLPQFKLSCVFESEMAN